MAAVINLLDQGRLDEAWQQARKMAPVAPGSYEYLVTTLLNQWASLATEEQAAIPSFQDNLDADFQFVPASHTTGKSDRMLIVFCGMAQRFGGCPLPLMHCLLGRLGVHLLYLRDFDHSFYLNGLRRHHFNFADTLEHIKAVGLQHGAERLFTIGSSSGGFGALHWGLELAAERIVSLAGPTNLTHRLPQIRSRQHDQGIPAAHLADAWAADAAARLRQPGPQPQFQLLYAAENDNDVRFAKDLGNPPPRHVSVQALEGSSAHNVVLPLLERNQLDSLLLNLVAP